MKAIVYRIAHAVGFLVAIPLLPLFLLNRPYREGFAAGMREEIARTSDWKLCLFGIAALWGSAYFAGRMILALWHQWVR